MKSYIITIRKKDTMDERRVHVSAQTLSEAALLGESNIDNLYEIIKIEVLE